MSQLSQKSKSSSGTREETTSSGKLSHVDEQELVPINPSPVEFQYEKVLPDSINYYNNEFYNYRRGTTLVWRDLNVYVKLKNGSLKRLVNDASGAIKSGTLIALMGASGAGKSTLMSALAHRSSVGTIVEGDIVVNGCRIGDFMHRDSGYMDQHDIFIDQLTVLEHLTIMAHLKLDRRTTPILRKRRINILLRQLGLYNVRYTRIGNGGCFHKLLSGGERKRLAFATELLTDPPLLFCDEPTTGLDSFSTQKLVKIMKTMAASGKTIVCTIHQPSSELFEMFDKFILLAEGRIAFNGTQRGALEFFERQGYHCPITYNPADFFIKILSLTPGSESASKHAIKSICDQFAVSDAAREVNMDIQLEMHLMESEDCDRKTNLDNLREPFFMMKLFWLTLRNFLVVLRDPNVQIFKIIQKLAIATTAGLCYVGSIQLTQSGIQAVQGALFIIIAENTFSPMYAVLAMFPDELPLFHREIRAGLYNTFTYYMAKMVSILPGLIIEPVLFTVVLYLIAGLRPTLYAFGYTLIFATLVLNVSIACGSFFSCAFGSMPVAIAYLVPFDYSLMITSGIFVKLSTIPIYIAWIRYLSWLMYSNEALSILQWDGIQNITCLTSNPNLPCIRTGEEVLDQYDFREENFYFDLYALLVLYFFFHTMAFICLRHRARRK